ncbi:MAG: Gfo/Idh/MocA family oxidoreductase [Gemmatimonadetes bacterium]|jgi:predicted dehydrogenase|nr:Gfo/Idh/MocA family oxidoreductase [Gemmatimonadota bacterium]MBT5328494.1 Gfo/Idh/MocA family oxidoreductase [Gemmatimonadota bacterium]MBT5451107.1 Gfo/Idh/MocA family oxidoreductase [Gemmatimonadota bacterium]MBT6618690.1 Gfo/Idh/MocA family oxidoreductase [Gemmatimonadota bacterium]MBT6904027.1 Gfo/Idh/MocA family oxidoreductase [Gemmatimonadota bacterium]
MPKALRVLVLGSGFAGQGHAEAFRNAGVEIIGMVSRTLSVTQQVAKEMNIPYATTDWKTALTQLQPDIVAVGTPGGVHVDPILAALDQSCHIYSDKPLAATAKEAKMLYLKAREEGAKTAYAASMRYLPYALLAKSLIAQGKIGDPLEVECISHPNVNPLIPFGWFHRLDQGGGRTHSNFPHKLSIVQQALNGTIVSVNGQLRYDIQRAPIAAGVHDFRKRGQFAPQSADEPGLEWAEADSDSSYTVLAHIAPENDTSKMVSVLFKQAGMHPGFQPDYMAFMGREATLHINGAFAQGPMHICARNGKWEEIPLPQEITNSLPNIEHPAVRCWTQLAHEFIADIKSEGYSGYQTFKDGWIYQEVFEAIRSEKGWVDIPQEA